MNRAEYLKDSDVGDFLDWAEPLVTEKRPLKHSWTSPKWGTRCFETLFSAYEHYEWRVRFTLPSGEQVDGSHYEDTVRVLNELRQQLQEAQEQDNAPGFLAATVEVLRWGRVRRTRLLELGNEALPRLTANAHLLHPASADLDRLSLVDSMNSGFSKIYSLMVDRFPIYDSRVACALASLVLWFCRCTSRKAVPESLSIGTLPHRAQGRRNPSCEHFSFPQISYGDTASYSRSNVKAAWLLGKLAEHPPFSRQGDPLHALQSAMFMVGYERLDRPCSHCPR